MNGLAFFCCRQLGCGLLIARIACRPLVIARVGALVGAVSYSALAGFSVPTVRAMVMASVVILLTGRRRTMPLPAVLGAALYAVLWVSPLAMLAAGGTLRHKELLAPFGLDASKPDFWQEGMSVISGFIDQLEAMEG